MPGWYSSLREIRDLRPGDADDVERGDPDEVVRRACARPDQRVTEELALEQHLRRVGRRKRRYSAGLKTRRRPDLVVCGDAGVACACRSRNLQRIGAPVAGQQREGRPAVADEDERLDDLAGFASDR